MWNLRLVFVSFAKVHGYALDQAVLKFFFNIRNTGPAITEKLELRETICFLRDFLNAETCLGYQDLLFLSAYFRFGVATADICIFMTWHLFYGWMPFLPPTLS